MDELTVRQEISWMATSEAVPKTDQKREGEGIGV